VLSAGYYDVCDLQAQKVRTLIKRDFEIAFDAGGGVFVRCLGRFVGPDLLGALAILDGLFLILGVA